MTRSIAYPNSLNRVVPMEEKSFMNRWRSRAMAGTSLLDPDRREAIIEEIMQAAQQHFDTLYEKEQEGKPLYTLTK